MNTHLVKKQSILALFSALTLFAFAQKKPLDHSVYDTWKSIGNTSITADGKYGATLVNEQEGDNQLQVFNLQTNKKVILDRAYNYRLAPNNDFIIALIKAPFSDTREAKIKKIATEKMPKDSLAIITLRDFSVVKIPRVSSFKMGKDTTRYIAYMLADTVKAKDKAPTLIVRNLYTAKEDSLFNASEYEFSKNGKSLAVSTQPVAKDSINKNEILLIDLQTNYNKMVVSIGHRGYKHLALSESGKNLAFLATADSLKAEIKNYALYHYTPNSDSAQLVMDMNHSKMPKGWNVSDNYKPQFSKSEKRLLLGTAPIPLPKDTIIPDFEKAGLDIWHWQEPDIQPKQWSELKKKQQETFLAYVDLENNKDFVQLGTEETPEIQIPNQGDGRYAVGVSRLPYLFEVQWDIAARTTYDVWIYDLEKNTRKQIKTELKAHYNLSPNGQYLAWYDLSDGAYYTYAFATDSEVCLTDKLDINFWDEEYDMPSLPNPYGYMGWTENDKEFLVYDQYDIWKLDPTGNNQPENVSKQVGRDNNFVFRYIKTDPDSRFLKPKDDILFSAYNKITKEYGYYKLQKSKMKPLVVDKYYFSTPVKAKNKNTYLYTKSNFNTSPDLYITTNEWKTDTKLSDINPQMKDYNWGTSELVSWTAYDGKQTEGIVYKPEDFDPNKKYPVLVYFYEKLTDRLYRYLPPAPSRSTINIAYFVSNGYIVFTPDIYYKDGQPGESAYNSIVSGVEALSKNSWVDKDNIALQGQSWGGYQTAYLITRTNMFKVAGAGAPVSNMFSAYGGIRWQTGRSRQYQYEQTQSRIGATMWEAPELYMDNSPVFGAPKVETPLLIMHNDNDGAVPWYQGIELFMGLRRLGKPVWMLQYNKEEHNLVERRNAKDLSIRLEQFFDHYLKGKPMPVWMKTGVPATDKGRTYGFEYE